MKISYKWLQDFVDVDMLGLGSEEISRTLTTLGLAVELVETVGDDTIFDIDVTSNRPDCLNHLGVARELAAQFRLPLTMPNFAAPATDEGLAGNFPVEIAIEEPSLCPRYAGRVITNVRISESPDWLKRRLEAVGQRPISNLVDITNYVLFLLGQPLHAFDYEKLEGRRIVVRRPRPGELIRTLDGIDRSLDAEMLMICDGSSPVAVAGVMGGEESEISDASKTILLESAYFAPDSIRRTSRKLGLSTEASYRFERGADPELPVRALNLACRLIQELCGGVCVSPVIDRNPMVYERPDLLLRQQRIAQVLGFEISQENVVEVLSGLDFKPEVQGSDSVKVKVPGFRSDVSLEDDLVEEVARHYGYDKVPSRYPTPIQTGRSSVTASHERRLAKALTSLGFYEVINYSFTTPDKEEAFLEEVPDMIAVANPLTEMDTHLRTTLLPGLTRTVRENLNHGNSDVRLFEVGKAYFPNRDGVQGLACTEINRVALAVTGNRGATTWRQPAEKVDFFYLKGVVETLFESLDASLDFTPARNVSYLHPGIGAEVRMGEKAIGLVGQLHPRLMESFKFPEPVFLAELSLEEVFASDMAEPIYESLRRFPSIERDSSFLLDRETSFGKILSAVQALRIPELIDFRLVDLYQGQNLPQGKISLTVRLTFADQNRALTHAEVNALYDRVIATLQSDFAIESR